MSDPLISLVIPAYNEASYLSRMLASVAVARERFNGGAEAIEVIVADNRSTDSTAEIALEAGCRVVTAQVRCIAAVRNAGAAAAQGTILAFVDADSQIHSDTFNTIAGLLERPDIIGGATGVNPERWSVGIALTYALFVPVVWATGIDTGLVFCRRADFEKIGGYDEKMRFAEDVKFHAELWRLGRRRGARLVRASSAKAIYSTRKFDQFGDWHYFPIFFKAPFYLLVPRAGDGLADRYWYESGR
jgi:glycosyltransferase involved in cell wall biosynthesis